MGSDGDATREDLTIDNQYRQEACKKGDRPGANDRGYAASGTREQQEAARVPEATRGEHWAFRLGSGAGETGGNGMQVPERVPGSV